MVFTHEVPLTLPNATVHLDEWLFNLSEEEYQRCAKGIAVSEPAVVALSSA